MLEILPLIIGVGSLMTGSVLGYLARQSIAKRKKGTLEADLEKRINEAKAKSHSIISAAKEKAIKSLEIAKEEETKSKEEALKTTRLLRRKENTLEEESIKLEEKEKEFKNKIIELKKVKESIGELKQQTEKKLESVSGLSKDQAKKEIFENVEKDSEKEILERMHKLERDGEDRYAKRAKEILTDAIQKCALSQAQEITTTTVNLPNDEVKGRIIGKEGRNIKRLESLTGTEIIVDDTPEIAVISGFNPIRRHIAKIVLERLVKDGRIQPARIEDEVKKVQQEVDAQVKRAGEQAIFEVGILGLDPKLIELLGRLNFRTSYGQNVLLHSIEVSYLSSALAAEVKADVEVCKRAGLLHDIGKALDHQVQGSHIDIGVKVLEKLGEKKEIIDAMKSHHEDYPYESLEAILVQTADQISGARPGARRDSLEHYLKRLENLEKIANSFAGIEKAYAIQAGRELRVFVRPDEIDDLHAHKLAKEISSRIQEELKYPGEIKVTLIREKRIIEYAK
ncbi:MAG: ribonuclease Y [Candidatus Pacebacteria bacterium]|nr:ribonuclease Y [Candidatus Paceibacterota bacterium]